MSVPSENLAALRSWWLEVLRQIADLELQRRTWIDPTNNNPHWSYIEFACSYPDDDQLKSARADELISPLEAGILETFGRVLAAYKAPAGNDWDNEAVLNDPAWHRVVSAAQVAKSDLEALR